MRSPVVNNVQLKVSNLTKRFGGVNATNSINLEVEYGQLHAVVGPNGSGKTTLLRQLFGEIRQDIGTIHLEDRDISSLIVPDRVKAGLGRSYQITNFFKGLSVLQNIIFGVSSSENNFQNSQIFHPISKLEKEKAAELVSRVGLEDRKKVLADHLSHGEQRQLEIAIALSTNPKLLLLDEPLAGLGVGESVKIISLIESLRGKISILMVEHDMKAVASLADQVTVLEEGIVRQSGDVDIISYNTQS